MAMRGLNVFISDIRNCRSREEEEKRINKEMGNIRAKFKEGKLNSYDKKKYVCKMLYMYILGWELDFGHVEAVNLVSGNKYTEKQIGYLAVTLMLSENTDLIRIVVNSMKNDLTNYNEVFNCLALAAIANIGGREMAEALYPDVFRLLTSEGNPFVRKKAAICLLRLFRKSPETLPASDWAKAIIPLIDDADVGVASSVVTLITALAQQFPNEYAGCVPKVLDRLDQLLQGNVRSDYEYYRIASPWLQVKCLRLLQCYPPPENQSQMNSVKSIINRVIAKSQDNVKPGNFANALNAIILEAVNLAVHIDPESEMVKKSIALLGSFISHKETNFRYLGLETMATLAVAVESLDPIKKHTDAVLQALRDRDISVRRRGLDLLYCMCDTSNSRRIVQELLQYLAVSDFAIREELVLKIAVLAERFATDYAWYVDVILQLIAIAGDHVSEDVWYRVVQIVMNNQDLQKYAAGTVLAALRSSSWHETAVKVAGYILGEFGDLIADEPNSAPIDQFVALHSKFGACAIPTKSLLFTTYLKLVNLFPEIKDEVLNVFRQYSDVLDTEMQQRACEYLAIILNPNPSILENVCEEMPAFPEREESRLVSLVVKNSEPGDKALRPRTHKDRASANALQRSDSGRRGSNSSLERPTSKPVEQSPAPKPAPSVAPSQPPPSLGAPTTKPSNDLEDLLGLGIGGSPAQTNQNALASILGIGQPSPAVSSQPTLNIFDPLEALGGHAVPPQGSTGLAPGSEKGFLKLVHTNEGVLFEDGTLQVGVKSEFRAASGRVALYFGNKSSYPLDSFATSLAPEAALRIQSQPVANAIGPQAQVQQLFQIECLAEFAEAPVLAIRFTVAGALKVYNLAFPVVVTKFVDPIQITGDDFFARWKQIGGAPKEVQRDIKAPIDLQAIRTILTGMKFSVLDGIDPNPSNFVSAGIFMTSSAKVGSLIRVQTSPTDQAIRITARTTNPAVSEIIVALLAKKISNPLN